MATKRMLIDATHPEETRVVVLNGDRLEEFDVEVATRKQLKGNIYLAKVVRVEPSLQAAFVDYGGNRHGFLAFNEIHPDYYQIPIADRQALLAEHDAAEKADEDARLAEGEDGERRGIEVVGGDDSEEVEVRRQLPSPRHYRIQEVIKHRQILLVQVVKEERGNKGAALTTYLSLAGRYCVLMPNTARGGGISRKITNAADRKRLKSILSELDIPMGMGVIVRTAGEERNKAEIKRDYDYLLRLWDSVRELTLKSTAPTLVHEEANLIKRSIRDMYSRDIEEIIVDGDEGCRAAKDFMKLLMPSHGKRVKPWPGDNSPLFHHYRVESQLDSMHSPRVQLKSGAYVVLNPTEALVSVDVNSGRATRERNIEETALKTNLEAADEIARQLRLRDLAGLVVIDFIDMEIARNQTQVERRLKEAMRRDQARIQLGRISPFGLMELSRQRLRPSLFETSFENCRHCGGSGVRRSTESTALHVLRAIEEEGIRRGGDELTVHVPTTVALYILNQKRAALVDLEKRYETAITFTADETLIPPELRIERVKGEVPVPVEARQADEAERAEGSPAAAEQDGKRRRRSKPRRRKQTEEATEETAESAPRPEETEPASTADESEGDAGTEREVAEADDDALGKRRRRGNRGGRRRSRKVAEQESARQAGAANAAERSDDPVKSDDPVEPSAEPAAPEMGAVAFDVVPVEEPAGVRTIDADGPGSISPVRVIPIREPAPEAAAKEDAAANGARTRAAPRRSQRPEAQDEGEEKPLPEPVPAEETATDKAPSEPEQESPRRGWWQRLTE